MAPTNTELIRSTYIRRKIHTGTVALPGTSHGTVSSALSVLADKLVGAVIL